LAVNDLGNPDERGKQLQRDIQELYSTLQRSNSLRASPLVNDVSDLIAGYIPEGTSFDDAERMLRSAGFTVYPRPGPDVPGERKDKFDVFAHVLLPGPWMSSNELAVSLRPKSPGDYSTVRKIWAAITVRYL
jgi:hypothetical protein